MKMAKERKNTAIYEAYDENEPFDAALPEKNLLRAILLTAMNDLTKPGDPARKATEFFLNKSEDYIFSFRSICNHLDIDPRTILIVTGLRSLGKRTSQPAKNVAEDANLEKSE